jgi:hypothetical protein
MTNGRLLAVGGAGALAALLAGGLVSVYADDSTSGVILTQDSGTTDDSESDREAPSPYLEKVAGQLGITVDALTEALKGASLETVEEKLDAGEITEERAAELRERIEAGEVTFGFGGAGRGHGSHGPSLGVSRDEIAAFLGIEAAALNEALASGQTLAEVAEANGKSREELKAFLTEEATAAINEALVAGDITQEQADEKLANLSDRLDEKIDSQFLGHPGPRGMAPSGTTTDGASFSYSGISASPLF